MNEITWKNLYDKYSGYIVKDINGKYFAENTNVLGYWNELEGIENDTLKVNKIFKYKGLKILLIENTPEYECGDYEENFKTIEEALDYIASCYER